MDEQKLCWPGNELKLNMKSGNNFKKAGLLVSVILLLALPLYAQSQDDPLFAQSSGAKTMSIFSEPGFIIAITLILLAILAVMIILIVKVRNAARQYQIKKEREEAAQFTKNINTLTDDEVEATLRKREEALKYKLNQNELSGGFKPEDTRGCSVILRVRVAYRHGLTILLKQPLQVFQIATLHLPVPNISLSAK